MKLSLSFEELLGILGNPEHEGEPADRLSGVAPIETAQAGDLTFLGNPKYQSYLTASQASFVIVSNTLNCTPNAGQCFLRVEEPTLALAKICYYLEGQLFPKEEAGIHPSAVIDPEATVDPTAYVGPLCVIERGARVGARVQLQAQVYLGKESSVGDDSHIMPGVRIMEYCEVGKRCRIHGGAVLGADGYGYFQQEGRHVKLPQVGCVVVEDDVEIGANTTIDRARFAQTRVGEGTKIDNLVQVAHNVEIGKHSLVISQVGISGSTKVGNGVVIAGQVGIVDNITIGDGVKIGAQSGVNANIEPGANVRGAPAINYMMAQRLAVLKRRLPELFERVKHLEELTKSLEMEESHAAGRS